MAVRTTPIHRRVTPRQLILTLLVDLAVDQLAQISLEFFNLVCRQINLAQPSGLINGAADTVFRLSLRADLLKELLHFSEALRDEILIRVQ